MQRSNVFSTSSDVDCDRAMTVVDFGSMAPPLVPRRPAARRQEIGGLLPRRKVPAVPPPADPDPVEQNCINEAVWVSSSAGLPFNLSQVIEQPAVSECCVQNRVQRTVEPPFNNDRLTPQLYPSLSRRPLNSSSMSQWHHSGSLPRSSVSTTTTGESRSHGGIVTLPHWPENRSHGSLITLPRWPESRSHSGIVTLPHWPIASPLPDRNSDRALVDLPVAGVADLHFKRKDNEYVASPTLGLPVEVQLSAGSEALLPLSRNPSVVVKSSDDGKSSKVFDKKLSMLRDVDERSADCQSNSGPLVCPKCAGCRCKSCADADRKVRSAVKFCSCAGPVQYLCRSRKDELHYQDCQQEWISNDQKRDRRCRHVALGMLVATLCLPCLCCYWPLKAGHKAVSACRRRFTGQIGVCRCPPDNVNAEFV